MYKFNTVDEAIEDIKAGKIIIVVDDEDRENEGDLLMAAEKVTPEAINFMAKYGRGLICMPVIEERLKELNIGYMVDRNTDSHQTAFTVSIDAVETTTGISAYERALTVKKVIDPQAKGEDFKRPGHIFPLVAKKGGVLKRAGHTEAAVDLPNLAGLYPAGVICEIMNEDGTMARVPQLMEYSKEHNLKIITIADLIAYRRKKENYIKRTAEAKLPTKYGEFRIIGYENTLNGEHHVALVKGDVSDNLPVLVRVHSECLTGDAFGSLRCDCGEQYAAAMRRIEEEGRGILLYMRQEGRGIGLINKIKAYSLQDKGMDTVEANLALGFPEDMRDYGIGAQILADLGVKKVRLMTNNPRKIKGLSGFGIEIVDRVPIQMKHNERNEYYLKTKKEKLGHLLKFEEVK
ncbi:bifunctional 3,4-dihydroxy-2-butanone-4-phosphate synthase/GTP cyclohydrolase II [Clostridium sp. SYSU_GA19001]|uniref:bifunctional 3,4-dihydroxy-2-butanone-4-phosphate synthase/GTP cyclohydrolase II n=1 Tax=Clostridium caldaquaticum TaxID=2940653 RepID=UPI0020777D37|nr:bifunctional 3,4-dihydroxy-2-butanone-4-phosphate synthase/GTP cyclohydrolase II [Clostridium caldaquaticum]MCM8711642.1 bifunctional 3,4-dihydroxy-2-butanone-4-phosphate synthase/GTP cyclohydrolase II [Clostridium caldaquaticum]